MLRRLIRTGIAEALHSTVVDKMVGIVSGSQNMPLVLGYHRVVEDFRESARSSCHPNLISSQMLSHHLDWIGRRFHFISLDELGERLESGRPFKRPVAAVTFDDGYSDAYHVAFPLLKQKGIPAGFFVVTDIVGTSRVHTHDRLYLSLARAYSIWRSALRELTRLLTGLRILLPDMGRMRNGAGTPFLAMHVLLDALPQADVLRVIEALEGDVGIEESALNELRPLSWEMVSEMQRAGMTIGSHTKTHPLLTNESQEKVLDEAVGARRTLERRLGIPAKHFAYPSGKYAAGTVSAVAASGYRFAYSTCRHRDPTYPLLTIPRKIFWENSCLDARGRFSSAIMSCQVNSVFNFVNGCRDDHSGPLTTGMRCASTAQPDLLR